MNEILQILMERDELTKKEAIELVNDTISMIQFELSQGGGYDDVANIVADQLGLEMDYIMELI